MTPAIAMNRRDFIHRTVGLAAVSALGAKAEPVRAEGPLAREIGITTGSILKHLTVERRQGMLRLLDFPKLMREELDMRVIDLMTRTLASFEPGYLDRLRTAADRAGCMLTNLKMNQPDLDVASPDVATRRHAVGEYKRTMDAAARLGVRWVRPVPGRFKDADFKLLAESYRELIDHGASRGISLLIENVGWIKDDPDAIPRAIKEVGPGLSAQPDTGNWNDAVRYEGLAKAFPFASSCDFKVFDLEPDGTYKPYDLKRCFQIGWDAGFRGPWCLEHFNADLDQLWREMALLRDQLRGWMRETRAGTSG